MAGMVSAGAWAGAEDPAIVAAVEVLSFEIRQGASRAAAEANGVKGFAQLSEHELALPSLLVKGQAQPSREILAQVWPYALSLRYFASFRGAVEPPMGQAFFPEQIPDLDRKAGVGFLKQLNRYVGSLVGAPASGSPSYLRASRLALKDQEAVAAILARTFGGDAGRWQSGVAQGMHGVAVLVDRASTTLEQRFRGFMEGLDAGVRRGDAAALHLAEPLWALQRRLTRLEDRVERLEAIHAHLAGAVAWLASEAQAPDPAAGIEAFAADEDPSQP